MLEEHPSWWKHHATKLENYLQCPRKEFYSTILGWKAEVKTNHRHFGSAWHRGMEKLLLHGYTPEGIEAAAQAFIECYREQWGAETDSYFGAKTPSRAVEAFILYALEHNPRDVGQKVLHTEAYGAVPLNDQGRLIHFKVDSIIDTGEGVQVREFKTGSGVKRQWSDKWFLHPQVGAYSHLLYCLYPNRKILGVEIDGAHFLKTETKFVRVPCRLPLKMLDAWLTDTNRWCADFESNVELLMSYDNEERSTMVSFPRNPNSCMDYFGCEYHPFCISWSNPLRHTDVVPIGFYQEYWDPEMEVETATENLGRLV